MPTKVGTTNAFVPNFLLTIALTACVWLPLGPGVCLAADEADLIEFDQVSAAQRFGWGALPGAVLTTVAPGKIGEHALRVDAGPQPQEYMGIELSREFDLSGAGGEDKLIFFVKQNFGPNICINLRTAQGNVYRYATITLGEWSRVELDLDLAQWEKPEGVNLTAWPKVVYLHIYSRGFDAADEYLLMDGFAVLIGGKPLITIPRTAPVKD